MPLVQIETGQDDENLMIRGIRFNDYVGISVADAGDVNGDGLPDAILGAPSASDNPYDPYNFSGAAYVVFSQAVPDAASMYFAYSRPGDGAGGAIVPETPLPDARMTIDFSDDDFGDDGNGGASLETVVLYRSSNGIGNLVTAGLTTALADVAWKFLTDRENWDDAELVLKYTDAELGPLAGAEHALALFTAPALQGPWTNIAKTVDPDRNEIAVTVGPGQDPAFFAIGLNTATIWANFGHDGTEVGVQEFPFNTLQEAVDAVRSGGTVKIDASATNATAETLTINKPVTLQAVDGTARIGAL